MIIQGFTISSIQKRKFRAREKYGFRSEDTEARWCVTLRANWIPDRFASLWFDNEAQARAVKAGPIDVGEVFKLFDPINSVYVVRDIEKTKAKLPSPNAVTDDASVRDAWNVYMEGQRGAMRRWAELWYAHEGEARQWAKDRAYQAADMLRMFRIITWVPGAPASPGGSRKLVTFYPEGEYPEAVNDPGFFDKNGYHPPGNYPAGHYGAGYYLGEVNVFKLGQINVASTGYLLGANKDFFLVQLLGTGKFQQIDF